MHPGVTVSPHCGRTNAKWRVHVGLVVPDGAHAANLRVGAETIRWREGESFVFDDSYEHEVYWEPRPAEVLLAPEHARLVLILDVLHPQLNGGPVCPGGAGGGGGAGGKDEV